MAFDYRRAFCAGADKYAIVFGGFWHVSEIETAFLGDFHNLEPIFNQQGRELPELLEFAVAVAYERKVFSLVPGCYSEIFTHISFSFIGKP